MAASSQSSSGIIAGINVTPLVDIMLVLLIIFMVTARIAMAPPKGLPLTLPKSATGESVELVFAVALYADDSVTVNGQRLINDDALLGQATAEHTAHPEVRAVIQADGKVLHERVIHAVDLLSQAGISQIAFGVTLSHAATPAAPAAK